MNVKTQKFLVLGISKSGRSAGEYVLKSGGECYFYEELNSPVIDLAIKDLTALGGKRVDKENIDQIIEKIDAVIVSPGVPINHEIAVRAKKSGKRLISELEFGFSCLEPCVVAVTGTNGKTTTVSLIENVLKESKKETFAVGNVGVPVTGEVSRIGKDAVCVAEVSSFQLETTNYFRPHVACVLNVAPDHLERHYTMENYIFLKGKLLKNQTQTEYSVLNYDDQTVKEFQKNTLAKVVWVSLYERVDGAYRQNGKLYYNDEYVMDESELTIFGEHNVQNALFAIAVCKLLKVDTKIISNALSSFKGVKHRIELVCEKNGKKYFDDSKATNTASTITALNAMRSETVLILGGSEKGESFEPLFNKIRTSPIKHVVLTGASRYHMLDDAIKVGYSELTISSDFSSAVKIADKFAESGDAVLLSPACASFDCFKNYEERGQTFVNIVGEL